MKEGAKIVSSKAFCPLNFRITDRNLSGMYYFVEFLKKIICHGEKKQKNNQIINIFSSVKFILDHIKNVKFSFHLFYFFIKFYHHCFHTSIRLVPIILFSS